MRNILLSTLLLSAVMLVPTTGAHATWFNSETSLVDTSSTNQPKLPDVVDSAGDQAPPQFTNVIDDLPLMPGLTIVTDDDVLFVTPKSGRLAETVATGTVDIDDVYRFYRASLPPLGWQRLDGRTFMRDNEILRIDAKAVGKLATVRFSLKPKP